MRASALITAPRRAAEHRYAQHPARSGRRAAAKLTVHQLVTIACVGGLTVVACGCGAGTDDPPASILTRAAASDAAFGVRYSFHTRFTDDDGTHRVRGYGQAQADQRRSRTVLLDGKMRVETIVDGDEEYSGGDAAATVLLESPSRDVRWTKLDLSRFLDAGYLDRVCSADPPVKITGVLAHSDPTIKKLGAGRVDGRRTQRYRVTTTYGRILDVLAGNTDAAQCNAHDRSATFLAELWIDRRNLVRRVRLRYRLVDGATDETHDITGYDRSVRITVPSARTVGDVTDPILKLADSVCKTSDAC
jgi:hypothetical protein